MTPRNWRRRWFVVRDDCIAYYYTSLSVSRGVVIGPISCDTLYSYDLRQLAISDGVTNELPSIYGQSL